MNEEFEQYLHLKRFTDEKADREWLESLGPLRSPHYGTTYQEYKQIWIESALYYIEQYEKQHPEWKELGDKEREEYWK